MNWLTSRMAELPSFGNLHENGQSIGEIPIRVLPFNYIEDALRNVGVVIDLSKVGIQASDLHLYTEDYSFAAPRPGIAPVAAVVGPSAVPSLFTTVLDDRQGTGLYLPDDDSDNQDIQFFTSDERRRIGRVHLTGELTSASASLTSVRRQEPGPGDCPDGYCTERVGAACGNRCHCREYPDAARKVRGRLAQTLRLPQVPIQVSVVKCTRDP